MSWGSITISGALAVFSIVMNFGNFAYTTRTYAVTHRAYIGAVEANFHLFGDPPSAMSWSFTLKNVGSVPGWMRTDEYVATLTTDGRSITLPTQREKGEGRNFLMPGQTVGVSGNINDAILGPNTIMNVLAGKAQLEVRLRLSYESGGALWGANRYYYMAQSRFRTDVGPPVFVIVWAEAD